MQQRYAALVGLGLCQLEQRTDLKAYGISCVTSLEKKKLNKLKNFHIVFSRKQETAQLT